MAQYINREKLLKRMEGYCKANCCCKPYEDALCPSCGLGDAIYMVEEQRIVNSRNMRCRKDAAEALSKKEKTTRWIPVTERLPEPKFAREWYLVALESGCVKSLAYEKEGRTDNLFRPGWHETASPVTHWMPLPDAPKEGV